MKDWGCLHFSTQRSILAEGGRLAEGEIQTDSKETKGLGKALFDAVGFLSHLFGSLMLLAIAVGTIGGILMSTRRLLQVKRVEKGKDDDLGGQECVGK